MCFAHSIHKYKIKVAAANAIVVVVFYSRLKPWVKNRNNSSVGCKLSCCQILLKICCLNQLTKFLRPVSVFEVALLIDRHEWLTLGWLSTYELISTLRCYKMVSYVVGTTTTKGWKFRCEFVNSSCPRLCLLADSVNLCYLVHALCLCVYLT